MMFLTGLHVLQWLFIAICAPLLGLLLYAMIKEFHVVDLLKTQYVRGYDNGWMDGYEFAVLELHNAGIQAAQGVCAMTSEDTDEPPEEIPA